MARQRPLANKLDDIISSFYEDPLEPKIKASKEVLELFQDFANLETLLEHGTVCATKTHYCQFSVVLLRKTINAISTCLSIH